MRISFPFGFFNFTFLLFLSVQFDFQCVSSCTRGIHPFLHGGQWGRKRKGCFLFSRLIMRYMHDCRFWVSFRFFSHDRRRFRHRRWRGFCRRATRTREEPSTGAAFGSPVSVLANYSWLTLIHQSSREFCFFSIDTHLRLPQVSFDITQYKKLSTL